MARALRRQDHPTLPASHPELQSIIKRFFTQLCPPGGNEGLDCILSASSSAELAAVLDRVHGLASESRRQARAATTPLATGYAVPFGLHPTTSSAQPSVPFGFSTPLNVHAPQHIGSFGLGLLQPAQQHRSAPTSTNLAYTGSDDTSLLRVTSRSDPNAELEEQIALMVQRKADAVANEDYRKVCASVGQLCFVFDFTLHMVSYTVWMWAFFSCRQPNSRKSLTSFAPSTKRLCSTPSSRMRCGWNGLQQGPTSKPRSVLSSSKRPTLWLAKRTSRCGRRWSCILALPRAAAL